MTSREQIYTLRAFSAEWISRHHLHFRAVLKNTRNNSLHGYERTVDFRDCKLKKSLSLLFWFLTFERGLVPKNWIPFDVQ